MGVGVIKGGVIVAVPKWGRVPLPSTVCVTQHTADCGAAATLCPGQERLILTVNAHVSFKTALKAC